MREILFRGKKKDNGEWVYGYYLNYGDAGKERTYIMPDYASCLYSCEVFPETVGQFTGLTDKNGNRIFEGDICKTYRGVCGDEILIVKYDECTARFILSTEGLNVDFDWFLSCKVIGNVHDNHELLGGGENG